MTVKDSYNTIARTYAERIFDELRNKPMDRTWLGQFAEHVRGQGTVCDLGCGPGHIARHLDACGLKDVVGVDLSQEMIREARHLNPTLTFQQGDMLALTEKDNVWAGIAAFYAIVNIPRHLLPTALSEMHRVIAPGGMLILAFHIGQEVVHLDTWWDYEVDIDFVFFDLKEVVDALTAQGFEIVQATTRPPYPDVEHPTERGYIMARVSS